MRSTVTTVTCFNSTLVQLKGFAVKLAHLNNTSFNSTLVQLKEIQYDKQFENMCCFNSTLVQLKATRATTCCLPQRSFNSTLVQLKVNIQQRRAKMLGLFQFYLSSIKSNPLTDLKPAQE